MKREEFISWAESRGWKMDRFGHLQVERRSLDPLSSEKVRYRFKLSRIAVRHEVKSASGWVRVRSGYFSKLSITSDGKLAGLVK